MLGNFLPTTDTAVKKTDKGAYIQMEDKKERKGGREVGREGENSQWSEFGYYILNLILYFEFNIIFWI